MTRQHLALAFLALTGACTGGSDNARIPGYLTSDDCNGYTDEETCAAGGCAWIGLECPEDADCNGGLCYQPDPCHAHGDPDSCLADADNACQWAEVELCPPDVEECPDGFCYGGGTDPCACVCPMYCPEGEECPPCECSCPPPDDGGGGGTCTCVCPECPEGEECPPCECTCEEEGGGCEEDGTCTCVCPECGPDQSCPPCECDCDESTGEPPADQAPQPADPCQEHTDELTCLEDTANQCTWYALGIPCMEGEECVSGVCQGPSPPDGDDCTCVCPECDAEPCPLMPCYCECGGGEGCVEPDPVPPA